MRVGIREQLAVVVLVTALVPLAVGIGEESPSSLPPLLKRLTSSLEATPQKAAADTDREIANSLFYRSSPSPYG